MISCSVVVTSYNQKATLELLFASFNRQTFKDFEIIIADDGSSDGSETLCANQDNLKVSFVTQPDLGYQKAKILNKAIQMCKSEYLIFIDGDVILNEYFISDHLELKRPHSFVCGRRVDLGPEFSSTITSENVDDGQFDRFDWKLLKSCLRQDSSDFNRSMRVKSKILRRIFRYDEPIDILGSNFSCWKSDVLEVNGFNEDIESYWGEDGDLYVRLRNCGKQAIGAKAFCVQFHVFHKRREPTKENMERFYRLLKDNRYKWAEKGLIGKT